jgi:hypothetical protein
MELDKFKRGEKILSCVDELTHAINSSDNDIVIVFRNSSDKEQFSFTPMVSEFLITEFSVIIGKLNEEFKSL